LDEILGDRAGSSSDSSESEDNDKTLFCFKSEFENALVLVRLDPFVLWLEMLAALEASHGHGGDFMFA
jgi:hypothetical protein